MERITRRSFLHASLMASGAILTPPYPAAWAEAEASPAVAAPSLPDAPLSPDAIDFRYAPVLRQTAFCFPDDPHKSLIHQTGRLAYGYNSRAGIEYFPLTLDFGMDGMSPDQLVTQTLESPSVPILRTVLERAQGTLTLTTFATNNPAEGRVDNVYLTVQPRQAPSLGSAPSANNTASIRVAPWIKINCATPHVLHTQGRSLILQSSDPSHSKVLLLAQILSESLPATRSGSLQTVSDTEQQLVFSSVPASVAQPCRIFIRIPQAGQSAATLQSGLDNPDAQLAAARRFWTGWSPFHSPVAWQVAGRQGEFVTACARNILQAREERQGRLTFQVGPTCYRDLWVVDGNFILEAAQYLGYRQQAIEGLKTTWSRQEPSGQIIAGGGSGHYKDTAIAMFTLVRQCELTQDWSLLREYQSQVAAGLGYIDSLRARSRAEGGVLGEYNLLPKGFSDGGLAVGVEITNTLWTIAGLQAMGAAARRQNLPQLTRASTIAQQLLTGLRQAAPHQMRSFNGQFAYLPMLLKEDPKWQLPDPWDRPRPQSAQWAMSHTIFPGRVFPPDDPLVQGHIRLMQAVCQEGIPAETGWNHHEAVWTYNAAFVAQVYLWLNMRQAAHNTFVSFLNHASPQYCWREEQPLQHALIGSYVGDMPHNWASAECIRYVRHMLALEDGDHLRLLAGITPSELETRAPYGLTATPTRFGPLDLTLEPLDRNAGWRLHYLRRQGPAPAAVSIPSSLGSLHLQPGRNGTLSQQGGEVSLDPTLEEWEVQYRSVPY